MNRRSFLPRAVDPGSVESRLPLAERPARHPRWAAAIADAFFRADRLRNRSGHFILDSQNVAEIILVRFRPNMGLVVNGNKLRVDADLVATATHAAF